MKATNLESMLEQSGGLVGKSLKAIGSMAGTLGIVAISVAAGGATPIMLAAGFNIGNILEKRSAGKKNTLRDLKSETQTGLVTGVMHNYVYDALRKIPADSLAGLGGRSLGVLLYSIPYIAVTKGMKYLTSKTWCKNAREFAAGPVKYMKRLVRNGMSPGYWATLKDTWKKMGIPLTLNINYTPADYRIPASVGLGAWYRSIQGKKSLAT